MAEIFISYSRNDRPRAQRLAEALVRRGYSVWWDVNLLPGADFSTEIASVIQGAKAAIVLWSSSSIMSMFVRDEAALASRLGILIPILIEPVQPPLGYGSYHYADMSNWTGDPAAAALEPVFQAIMAKVPQPSGPAVTSSAAVETALNTFKDEAAYWISISSVPNQRVEEYQGYLARFGSNAVFADLARSRIAKFQTDSQISSESKFRFNLAHFGDRANVWLGIAGALVGLITALVAVWHWYWPNNGSASASESAGKVPGTKPADVGLEETGPGRVSHGKAGLDPSPTPESLETPTGPLDGEDVSGGSEKRIPYSVGSSARLVKEDPVACGLFEDGKDVVTKSCQSSGVGNWIVYVKKTTPNTPSPDYTIYGSIDEEVCGSAKLSATKDEDYFSCSAKSNDVDQLVVSIRPSVLDGFDAYRVPIWIKVTRAR